MTSTAVTITLPGPPLMFAIEPEALARWLVGRGWSERPARNPPGHWRTFDRDGNIMSIPRVDCWPAEASLSNALADSIVRMTEREDMEPSALAAALCAPAPTSPAQWAHLSAAQRAPVLDVLAREAAARREDAREEREGGQAAVALHFEGEAMALGAVLRAKPKEGT